MLNDKQERFCIEYLIDLNATKAAIRAGYSEKTARQIGERLLSNVDISARVSELRQSQQQRTQITADMVIAELVKIGFNNIQDYIEEGNRIKDLTTISRDLAASVASIKITETRVIQKDKIIEVRVNTEFKLHNKLDALEKLGRHIGIYEQDNKQKSEIRTWVYARASEKPILPSLDKR